jgi:hypothetical protein
VRTALLFILLPLCLLLGGCKDKDKDTLISVLGPLLIAQAQDLVNDPGFRSKLGGDGNLIADAALAFLLPRLQNEIARFASSSNPDERLAYKRIQRSEYDLPAMLYRQDANGTPAGLWPRLEASLAAKGYLRPDTRVSFMTVSPVNIKFSAADTADLTGLARTAILEEYDATRAVEPATDAYSAFE